MGTEVIDNLIVRSDESSMELDTSCQEGMEEIKSQKLLAKTASHSGNSEQTIQTVLK